MSYFRSCVNDDTDMQFLSAYSRSDRDARRRRSCETRRDAISLNEVTSYPIKREREREYPAESKVPGVKLRCPGERVN